MQKNLLEQSNKSQIFNDIFMMKHIPNHKHIILVA